MTVRRPSLDQAEQLRAVAHRVRMDLLDLLERGPLTAADAARALGQTPSNVSWHLRHLAQYGMVRQLPEQSRRRRPWKVVTQAVASGDDTPSSTERSQRARAAYDDVAWMRDLEAARRARHQPRPAGGADLPAQPDHERLWLTPSEAEALATALDAAVAPYRNRQTDGSGDDVRLMSVVAWVVPTG